MNMYIIVTIIVIEQNVCNWSILFQLQLNYTFICVFKLFSLNLLSNILFYLLQ